MEKNNKVQQNKTNRVINDFKSFGIFFKNNILKIIVIEVILLVTLFCLYFSIALISKQYNILGGYLLLATTIVCFVFLFAFTYMFFARRLKDTDDKEFEESNCFYFYFSSLFFDGIVLTVFFLIFKAINESSKLLIQGLSFIVSCICLFLIFGAAVFFPFAKSVLFKKKGDINI